MKYKSLFIDLKNKSCFVIGGGKAAAKMAERLLKEGALVTVWSETFTAEFQDLLKGYSKQLNLLQAPFTNSVAEHYCSAKVKPFIVVTALPDEDENQMLCEICKRNNVLSANLKSFDSEVVFVDNYSEEPMELALLLKEMPVLGSLLQAKIAKQISEQWMDAVIAYQQYHENEFVLGLNDIEKRIFIRRLAEEIIKADGDFSVAEKEAKAYFENLQQKDELLLELANERSQMD